MAPSKLTPSSGVKKSTSTPRKVTPKKNSSAFSAAKRKTKTKPNGSILMYFKKAPEEGLFIGGGEGADTAGEEKENVIEEEDAEEVAEAVQEGQEEDIFGSGDENVTAGGKRVLNEGEGSSVQKKRKLSDDDDGTGKLDGEEKKTSTRPTAVVVLQPDKRRKRSANPFLDDSSEDEEEDDDDEGETKMVRQKTLKNDFEEKEEENRRLINGDDRRILVQNERQQQPPPPQPPKDIEDWVPLLRQETSGAADTKFNDENDYDYENEFPAEDFTGEELEAMRAMEEQARLEAEEDFDSGGGGGENSCPVCGGSFDGVTESDAMVHVNSCLDGNPTPLPTVLRLKETAVLEDIEETSVETTRKGLASKAAVARPGQSIPFTLGEETNGSGEGSSSSAFTKLMSGHAEDTAWAVAASAEQASRGMPAYKRTCPFYKIMPGFSICVDAFRYGAVEGCKAYFLSHFHSDHYMGLSATWTYGPIYCSKVTGSLVKSQLKTAAKYVVKLEFEQTVPVPGIQGVTVTMIPANHCPGSSLFLFEKVTGPGGKTHRILHCGDFRACPAHVEHPQLRPETVDAISGKTRQQKIDVCYLDTTYLNPRYSFPPQGDVINACADICALLNKGIVSNDNTEWDALLRRREGGGATKGTSSVSKFFSPTTSNPSPEKPNPVPPQDAFTAIRSETRKNRLLVVCGTYSIGKERICVAIAQALKTKIFANPAKIRMCKQLDDPELSSLMTSNPREAQVHMQMLMELRADTLAEYLEAHRSNGFTKVIGFRPSGWNYRPVSTKNAPAILAPGSLSTSQILHGSNWKTEFKMSNIVPQRGATKEAMCFGVPYSEHSSFRELAVFLMSLRIEKVVPTVNVGSEVGRKRMKGWIDKWLGERRKGGLVRVLKNGEEGKLWEGGGGGGGGGGVYW